MDLTQVIIRPIITERSMEEVSKGKFTFEVAKQTDKQTIKKAVENIFKVNVVAVKTRITKGKKKRVGARRIEVKASPIKKATVVVKSGQKIDIFEVS